MITTLISLGGPLSLSENQGDQNRVLESIQQLYRYLNENITGINYKLGSLESIEKTSKNLRRATIVLTVIAFVLLIFALLQTYVFLVLIGVLPG